MQTDEHTQAALEALRVTSQQEGYPASASFPKCNAMNADMSHMQLENSYFYRSWLPNINFEDSRLKHVDFTYATMTRANFDEARLTDVDFRGADLRGADFTHADCTDCNFSACEMAGVTLKKMHSDGYLNLTRANGIRSISGVGEYQRTIYAVAHPITKANKSGLYFTAGCFYGTGEEILEAIAQKYHFGEKPLTRYGATGKDYAAAVKLCINWRKTISPEFVS